MTPQEKIWLAEDSQMMRREALADRITRAAFWFVLGMLAVLWMGA